MQNVCAVTKGGTVLKAVFAKPKINYCDLTTHVNYTVNHSELVVHTQQALENTCEQVTVGFRKSGFRE